MNRVVKTGDMKNMPDIQGKFWAFRLGCQKVAISGPELRQTAGDSTQEALEGISFSIACARWHLSKLQAMQSIQHLAQLNGVWKPRFLDVGVSKNVEGYPERAISIYLKGKILINHHFGAPYFQTNHDKPILLDRMLGSRGGGALPCMLPAT